ncbi:MAG TPA: hypothetical protein PLD20_15205 [Blastocatellia bacterium]|nr:hypothetical protein [Blastocatellia bacterium]HMV83117.1 hypothetical protein [Blastocatellia bacterium]HMY71145.1 hypothetical protein [Blastocatellia bacterium]HMZ19282.1 hypothetical protein [Blastocatellia bacterium]HNG33055.1 hypothetical protein [Blastocatellia bacterium]
MTTVATALTAEEIVRLGEEIYYRDILPNIEAGNDGRVVAIDIHSGEFELGETGRDSASRLRKRVPDAEVFFMRVGYPTFSRIRPIGRKR